MAYRRRRLVRLDALIIGADPAKLEAQSEVPAAAVSSPLTSKERIRLSILRMKAQRERLSPEEFYEFQQLKGRL